MTDRPEQFEGVIIIGWPRPSGYAVQDLDGWKVTVRLRGGAQVTTVTSMTIHAGAQDAVWAELEMFAGEDGRPLFTGDPVTAPGPDGEILTGVFPFLVSEMRVRGKGE